MARPKMIVKVNPALNEAQMVSLGRALGKSARDTVVQSAMREVVNVLNNSRGLDVHFLCTAEHEAARDAAMAHEDAAKVLRKFIRATRHTRVQ